MVHAIELSNAANSVSGHPVGYYAAVVFDTSLSSTPPQHYIPFTGSKLTDDNFEPLNLGLRSECMDLI